MACGLNQQTTHYKKMLATFPSPAGMSRGIDDKKNLMSLTELSLGGNWDSLVSDIPAGDGNVANLFFTVPSTCDPIQKLVFSPEIL